MKKISLNSDSILPMKLQYFAEGEGNTGQQADPSTAGASSQVNTNGTGAGSSESGSEGSKTYTDDEVNEIVNKKFAKWKKDEATKVAEAKKLAEMDKDEKTQYELEQAKIAREAAEAKVARFEMTGQARAMASEAGITVTDDDLAHIVTADADETKANLDWLGNLAKRIKSDVEADFLKGKSPKGSGSSLSQTKGELGKKLAENASQVKESPYFQNKK